MTLAGDHTPARQEERRTQMLVTAREAYPAFERAVLAARERINLSFRIFDLRTPLHSEEGRAVGSSWADLLAHVLRRGVNIRLVVTDFDPVGAPDLHRGSWRTMRQCAGLREIAGEDGTGTLEAIAARHPARIGKVPGAALWPIAAWKLRQAVQMLNGLPGGERRRFITEAPRLRPHLKEEGDTGDVIRANWWHGFRMTPATHHQKLAVIDGEVLYIGGLDLDERRWDTPKHDRPARKTWHDIQMLLHDAQIAGVAERHLDNFISQTAGEGPDPEGQHAGGQLTSGNLRFLTTMSTPSRLAPFRFSPKKLSSGLYDAHVARAEEARNLIYLETQFFRDRKLARHLAHRARENPDLKLLLVLPAAPEEVAFTSGGTDARYGEFLQSRCLRILRKGFGKRFFALSPAQRRKPGSEAEEAGKEAVGTADGAGRENGGLGRVALRGAPMIYVHAKLSVFDDTASIVSSANLNGRSLRWDTEAGLEFSGRDEVSMIRERVLAHWYPEADGAHRAEMLDPARAFEAWVSAAKRDAARQPEDREGYLLPHDLRPALRFGRAVPGVPEEMV
ncbi:phospholipase [Oceanicola sp. D3]|uniref:phospholipase D-like domain-containing protein n=1 Tax=Oceanicola sp. D3 TaxID=2587163 RepID=UPI0011238E0F|nr:phospholipase D-like domain-containing protein [Oceanicola sp. D3]QDC09987.1 phospholipase [Oceanicola sp. D3]